MLEQEAEEAAARRNREDPRRDRFVFYALDESAGIASDAWDVAMRLRRDDERPRRKSRVRAASTAPPAPRATATAVIEPEPEPEPEAEPEPEPEPEAELELVAPVAWESLAPTEVYEIEVEPADLPAPAPEPPAPRRRRFGLVRLWGVFVVLVGLAFIAAVLVVAIVFRDYTHLSTLTWGVGVAAGLVAVWLGIALAWRRH